ncbi:MAG: transglycosylase SLT domain-containing protein [Acidobacteriota bacterium]|jgi:soluble lytic murein transglycosylase|nr:transglycosylase SLT domain-containing protein [Acidobacteriota bacterium]
MRRYLLPGLTICVLFSIVGLYFFNRYWIHRYDDLIARQASVYHIDADLVWSVIYEETYFRAWMIGADDEVGLMQVTPTVAREWAKETGFREFERETSENVVEFLRVPERNIQIGCWYLETMREKYRRLPAEKAMSLAAYNAGASRVEEWTKNTDTTKMTEKEFIEKINIASTKAYVSSILKRYDEKIGTVFVF